MPKFTLCVDVDKTVYIEVEAKDLDEARLLGDKVTDEQVTELDKQQHIYNWTVGDVTENDNDQA